MDLSAAVAELFTPAADSSPGRVGVEIEAIATTSTPAMSASHPEIMAAGFDRAFVADARPSFEPGGQLELSPAPRATVGDVVRDATLLFVRACTIAAQQGVRLDLVGVDPYHDLSDVPLRRPTPRYLAMQRMFDAVGDDGRRMMRLTAALQVSVDLLPGRAGHEQWLVANLAGPALASAFANCPGVARSRTAIWRGVDLLRTGYDGRYFDPSQPVGAYAAFAQSAPPLPIPAAADPQYHLSTLFPPVRPRGGYLELRYLDAQPMARLADAVCVIAALMYEGRARREALDLLLPGAANLGAAWHAAANGESADAAALLQIADGGTGRLPRDYLPERCDGRWAA